MVVGLDIDGETGACPKGKVKRHFCRLTIHSSVHRKLAPQANYGGKAMIRKLKSGEYRLYSRKTDPKTGKRRNLGTFKTREAAEKHEREVQYFKRH